MASSVSKSLLKYGIAAVFAIGVVTFSCNQAKKEEAVLTSPFLNVYGDADYIGSSSCENCHADKHLTFQHTGMGMSFDSATKLKSAANFNNVHVYDSALNLHYTAYWKADSMFIVEYRLINGDTTHYRKEYISYIIGSGQHTNSHFWADNGYIYQAPLTWYVQEKKWGLPPGYEDNNIRFSRKIEMECMSCHNSLPHIDKESAHKYTMVPKGIGCESCHGPGSMHVKEKSKGITVNTAKEADYTIVNPKRLPWKLQIDVCQRCHLQGNAVLKEGKSFADFRPGMALSEIMQVYLPTYSNDNHGFVMASHAERFQQSKCFIKSNTNALDSYNAQYNFTCISCHNPHVSVKETNVKNFNNTCINCHKTSEQIKCTEKLDVRNLVKDNCVKCHMPLTGTADIPHVSIHDHYIRKPIKSKLNLPKGELTGLKSINGGEKGNAQMLAAYLTYFEKFDANNFYQKKADELLKDIDETKNLKLVVHYWYNKQNYKKIMELVKSTEPNMVNHDFMAYQIGQSYYQSLEYQKGLQWYGRAIELKPKQINYYLARINLLLALNDITNAKKELNFIIKEQPKNAKALYYYALIYYNQEKTGIAKQYLAKSIALDPDDKLSLALAKQLGL